jgi:two-component system chemotaxis response regulator CheV
MTSPTLSVASRRSELLARIDARTRLAGTNKLEILLFSLGTDLRTGRHETFGINVFKVREVMHAPEITTAPEMHPSVEGMVSLRGVLVPVVDLVKYAGVESGKKPGIMIVTEYNQKVQGFLVDSVDTILRLDWASMKVPPAMVNARMGGLLTAVTELDDGRLVMMLDVEKILAETMDLDEERLYQGIEPVADGHYTVFFADDSAVARKQIAHTLDALHVDYRSASNGLEAWNSLLEMASQAEAMGVPARHLVNLVLTDVEMPEMDGYVLTKNIKSDPRFDGIPVLMYSSLSSVNERLGRAMGVDEYVSKLQPHKLAEAVTRHLGRHAGEDRK